MVDLGLDYSDARPGGAALAAAHVVAVGRYLGNDSRCITPSEYQDLTRHGIGVWLVKESQTVDLSVSMLNGYNKGVADALAASAAIKQVGLPDGSPVYWAADFDIAPGSARVAQAESYVDGWNTIIPEGRRGGYGGLWFLNYLRGIGKVDFLWECASTSFRHGVNPASVPLHIQQTTDNPPIAGTDYNNIFDTSSFAGNGGATPIKTGDDMPIFNDTQRTIYWPNGFYNSYPAPVYGALKFWSENGSEQPGTEGTVTREVWAGNDFLIRREAQAVASAVSAVISQTSATSGTSAPSDDVLQKIAAAAAAAAVAALPKTFTVTAAN